MGDVRRALKRINPRKSPGHSRLCPQRVRCPDSGGIHLDIQPLGTIQISQISQLKGKNQTCTLFTLFTAAVGTDRWHVLQTVLSDQVPYNRTGYLTLYVAWPFLFTIFSSLEEASALSPSLSNIRPSLVSLIFLSSLPELCLPLLVVNNAVR